MSLSTALDTAKSSLAASQAQTALVARNIANVNTVGATKKYANVITGLNGQVQIKSVSQSSNYALFRNMLDASAAVGKGNVISNGLDRLSETLGDTELSRSPAAMVSKLSDALTTLSASPNNYELARNAVTAASDLVKTLNEASATTQTIRKDADTELVNAAAEMNKLLAKIETLNKEVVGGTRTGADVTDASDARDQAVAALSQYVGVNIVTRGENDMVLYTDSGVTLFETTARAVGFTATPGLNETVTEGNALTIDGTAVTGSTAYMPLKNGSVAGLVALRDDIMVTYQTQLDETARGLIDSFKESAAGMPDVPGLFTAVDPSTLATVSQLNVGTFDTAGTSPNQTLSFNFKYGDTTYVATGTLSATDLTDKNTFAAKLQSMVAAATPAGSTTALGAGKVSFAADGTGKITASAASVGGAVPMALSNIVPGPGGADGGLVAGTATATTPAVIGLAGSLRLADGVTANPTLLRDGIKYDYNTADLGGFTARLNQLSTAMATTRNFADDSSADSKGSVADYAASSVSWLQSTRQNSLNETEYKTTVLERTQDTLSNKTGINMDEQLTQMMQLERSFQASSKLLSTIDEMLKTLLNSI